MHFLNQSQDANELLEQPIVVSSVIHEFRNKKHYLETSEVEEVRTPNKPHHRILRDIAQINAFQYTFFPQVTVLNTITTPQIKLYSFFI